MKIFSLETKKHVVIWSMILGSLVVVFFAYLSKRQGIDFGFPVKFYGLNDSAVALNLVFWILLFWVLFSLKNFLEKKIKTPMFYFRKPKIK